VPPSRLRGHSARPFGTRSRLEALPSAARRRGSDKRRLGAYGSGARTALACDSESRPSMLLDHVRTSRHSSMRRRFLRLPQPGSCSRITHWPVSRDSFKSGWGSWPGKPRRAARSRSAVWASISDEHVGSTAGTLLLARHRFSRPVGPLLLDPSAHARALVISASTGALLVLAYVIANHYETEGRLSRGRRSA
jgi:hypothetical protein